MLIFKAQSEDSREWFVEIVEKAGNGIRTDAAASDAETDGVPER
jgi:hypothetical protein